MSSVQMTSAGSPLRSALNDRMNSFLRDSHQNMRTGSVDSPIKTREGLSAQIQRMRLEADLHLENNNVSEYLRTLDEIYGKVKLDNRFKKLSYHIAIEFQKFGLIEQSSTILAVLYEETNRYDDDTPNKAKKMFQFALDLGNNYFSMGRFKKAFEFYSISLKNLQQFSSWDISIAQLFSNKGLCWLYLQDYDVAENYFKKVIKTLVERIQDPRKEKLLMVVYKNLGAINELKQFDNQGENENSALKNYVKALKCGLKLYNPDHLEMADIHYHIWWWLLDQGKIYEAMQRLEKVIYLCNQNHETLKQNHDSYLPKLGSYYALLGQFYLKQEDYDNASKWFEATLSVWLDYGMDQKEIGFAKILDLQKHWMIMINQTL